jgi:hypothetical protein
MLLEDWAGLPTGMDGRGSCPARASISLIRVSRKSLCEIFSHHMKIKGCNCWQWPGPTGGKGPFLSTFISPQVCLELCVPSVMSEPKTQTFRLLSRHIGKKVRLHSCLRWYYRFVSTTSKVTISVKNSSRTVRGVNSGVMCVCVCVCSSTVFPVGGPSKGLHYTPLGFRG